jgi:hypothetical protein
MAGRVVVDRHDLCFVPRFGFTDGTSYTIEVDGVTAGRLLRRSSAPDPSARVIGIYPTARVIPRNLLRLYVRFSTPMAEGQAAHGVRLVDGGGVDMADALLATEQELWDGSRRRLTLLLDPARIKRGLLPHGELGYPLVVGDTFRVEVNRDFVDSRGAPLVSGARRSYRVGDDERRHVDPDLWSIVAPGIGTNEALEVWFDRPLDLALLLHCIRVARDGTEVAGTVEIGAGERSWRLWPEPAWTPGLYVIIIDPILEDLAGNSLTRVFDRDLGQQADEPRSGETSSLTFRVS